MISSTRTWVSPSRVCDGDTQQRYRAIARGVVLKKRCGNGVPRRIARVAIPPPILKVASKIMLNQAFDV